MGFSFRREPTVYLQGLQVALALLVSFKVLGLTEELSALVLAFAGAILGAYNAWKVQPVAPAAFTALVTTAAPLLAHFRLDMTTEQIGALQFAVLFTLALITRTQVSPVADPAPTVPADGSVR